MTTFQNNDDVSININFGSQYSQAKSDDVGTNAQLLNVVVVAVVAWYI